jgi:hypothetical protein
MYTKRRSPTSRETLFLSEHLPSREHEKLRGRTKRDLSSTLRIFPRLLQTPAQKIAASAMMRTACSMGAAVRPKGPNGAHRSHAHSTENLASFTQNILQITAITPHCLDLTFLINSARLIDGKTRNQ